MQINTDPGSGRFPDYTGVQPVDSATTTPSFQAERFAIPEGSTVNQPSGDIPNADPNFKSVESPITPLMDFNFGPETKYSKLRAGGTDKDTAKQMISNEYNALVAAGADPEATKNTLFGDGSVQWSRQQFEENEKVRDTTHKLALALDTINITMEDLMTGNINDKQKEAINKIGTFGVESGIYSSFDANSGTAYLKDGTPVSMIDVGVWPMLVANKHAISRSIILASVSQFSRGGRVSQTGKALVSSMGGSYSGAVKDVDVQQDELIDLGFYTEEDKLTAFDLNRRGAIEAVTDGVFGTTLDFMFRKGGAMVKGLITSLMGRNTHSAVRTLGELTGLTRPEMEKRAKLYAKAGNLKYDINDPTAINNLILRNEIENNTALQGYLTKVIEEPDIAQSLRESVKGRVDTMQGVGSSTTSSDMLKMFEDSHKEVSKMMGSVRGALDDTFKGINIPTEQFKRYSNSIVEKLAPYKITIEERRAGSALDLVNASIQAIGNTPTIGNLFKLKSDYGSLLNKIGLFEENQAKRSKSLGSVDTATLSDMYRMMDTQIEAVITKNKDLSSKDKASLLDFKRSGDKLYSKHMKAVNTSWVKSLSSESSTAKKSLNSLIDMAKEGRTEYDTIMKNLTKVNQDAIEQAMIRRTLKKAEVGDDGYALVKAADDLRQLKRKIKNPQVLNQIAAVEKSSKLFQQDPIISMLANNRMVLDKLAKAGLTYKPGASTLYAVWSKTFPKVQIAFVNVVEKVPGLGRLLEVTPGTSAVYSAIKTSAKELNVVAATDYAMRKGQKSSFGDFLSRVLREVDLPPKARQSIIEISKQYAKLADSFEANPAEVTRFREAVATDFQYAGPAPKGTDTNKIKQLRKEGKVAEANRVIAAEEAERLAKLRSEFRAAEIFKADNAVIANRRVKLEQAISDISNANSVGRNLLPAHPSYRRTSVKFISDSLATNSEVTFRGVGIYKPSANGDNTLTLLARPTTRDLKATLEDLADYNRVAGNLNGYVNVVLGRKYISVGTKSTLSPEIMQAISDKLNLKPHKATSAPTSIKAIGDEFSSISGLEAKATRSSITITVPGVAGDALDDTYFSFRGKYVSGYTEALNKKSSMGGLIYKSLWDAIDGTEYKYMPSGLSTTNEFRMAVNMLSYIAERGEAAPNVLINHRMVGASLALDSKPLTISNANTLAKGVGKYLNGLLPKGLQITAKSSDAQLYKMLDTRGELPVPYGLATLKLIRNYMKSGNITLSAAILLALSQQDDFMVTIEKS